MLMQDIIIKKRDKEKLTYDELKFFIDGYVKGDIPDYQVSSLLMAIVLNGMDNEEISTLTELMMHSGEVIDLSMIKGIKVDKHSTGGVGDKTSLVLGPLVSSCGAVLAKMSGRGLGFTGGTLDKLESIPGMSISLTKEEFVSQVNKIGISIIGQTGNLVPADKKLYALRDVTGTVPSIPLISSSIMSKKLASGSDAILLDVKFGSGAFMKDIDSARILAKTMVNIGKSLNRDTRAILTDMNQPLGKAVGNILEVKEAIDTLNGSGPSDFKELCLKAGAIMLLQAKVCSTKEEAYTLLNEKLNDGSAFNKFKEFISLQGGDISYIDNPALFKVAKKIYEVKANKKGFVKSISALDIGNAAMHLGAGRATKEDSIDFTAGIILNKKVGDKVEINDTLAIIHTNLDNFDKEKEEVLSSFESVDNKVELNPIVYEIIE